MAEYDPNDEDAAEQREQAAYDQEDAAAQQQLLRGEEPQTFGFNGQPVEQPAQQAIPTAPPPAPQQAAQAAPQQQPSDRYDVVWQQQPAPQAQAQPQQTQQPAQQPRSLTLAPYPGQGSGPRLTARERAAQNREAPYSTPVDIEERYDVAPELKLQPTGGLGSVVALDFENFGHDVLSAVNAFAKNQLNMPVPQLEALNAQFKEHIDKVRDGLDPARRTAQDVSIFDPSSFAGKDAGAVAEGYAVSLATGILGGLGPGLAAKMAVKTGLRIAGRAGSTAVGATAAEQAAAATAARAGNITAIGGAGVTGALQQTGARYEDYATTIDRMTDEDKQKSAMYQGFRAQNMDDAAAKEAMKSRFPMLQQLGVNFVTSTGIAAVTPGLGGAMPRLATRGRNIAAGAAEAGGSAGIGTAGSAAIQEQAKVEAGTQPAINWGRVAAEGAVAAGLGAGFGGAFGAFHGTTPAPARIDNVTPGGVPPEHTAALNAAGIGKPANPTWPGGTGRQDNPTWSGGPPPPPDPTWPRGSVRPPEPPPPPNPTWPERPPETPPQLALPAPALQLTASRERGPGFTMQEPAPAPLQLGASRERGPGFTMRDPDAPPNPTWPGGPVRPPEPLAPAAPTAPVAPPASPNPVWPGRAQLPPDTGPRLLTAARDRGEGFTMAEPAPAALQLGVSRERGAGFTMQEPAAAPAQVTASRARGPGFTTEPSPAREGGTARERLAESPVAKDEASIAANKAWQRDLLSREEGTVFRAEDGTFYRIMEGEYGKEIQRQGEDGAWERHYRPTQDNPGQLKVLSKAEVVGSHYDVEPGHNYATAEKAPGRAEAPSARQAEAPTPRPSEGLTPKQLIKALAAEGMPQAQINRLVQRGRDKLAAALDQRAQERAARGEESAPAPRGAEAREPAPAARPSEGMSHKALGEALEKLGLSKKEVNRFVNKVQRAAEYDRLVRREADAIERISGERKDEGEQPTTVRTVMEAGPDETKGHPQGEREDRRWRALKPERTADGKYKGAPEWVQTPRHYRQLQKLMKQLVKEGEKGRFWYEDSMKKIMAVTRGNLREADRLTGLVAIYSPQRPVPTNMGLAVKAYEQWHRGEPVRVGSGSQDARAQHWLDTGQDWGGRKTNNFYLNLMHELITAHPEVLEPGNNRLNLPADVAAAIKGATVDLWVLRAMGHRVDAAGGPGGTGARGGITDKYGFSQLEIQRLAGELNAGVPVGEQRWLPHQVQAALWSAIKARFELPAVKEATWKESLAAKFATMEPDKNGKLVPKAPDKNGPARQGHMAIWRKHALAADPADVANVIDRARGDFGAALDRMSQHVSVEAIPSKDLNHPINNASRAAQEQFTREAHALLLDEDGNNLLAQKVGVNLGYDTYGAGSFEGKVSPNVVTTLVPEKPAGIFDRAKARAYARAAQFIYRQDAVPIFRLDAAHDFTGDYAAHNPTNTATRRFDSQAEAEAHAATRPGWTVSGGEISDGVHLDFGRPLDPATQARLLAELGRELGPDAGFTKVGDNEAIVVNFRGENGIPQVDDERFGAAIKRIVEHPDINVEKAIRFGADGEYGPVHNWKEDASGGSLPTDAGGSPAFQSWLHDRHAAFGKLLDDWSNPEARYAASRPGERGGAGPDGRSTLELPQARAPPDARAARERAAERRAEGVEATPEDLPPVREEQPLDASREQRNQPTATESPLSRVMKDDRVNAPVREAIDAGGSLHDGLRAIANNPFINKRLPHVAAYARSMLRLAPDLPLRPSETVRRGAFVSEENLVTGRRAEHVEVREKSAEVLLHEATHGTVGHFVDSLQPGSREFQVLTTIRDEFARGAEAHGRLGDEQVAYALSNPHELHSMLRTNPEMHDLMRGIVPTAEYRARMAQLGYPVGPAKSLWQSFVRFIRQALKLPQNVTSLMDHVMRPLDDIAEAGARFNRDLPTSTRDSMVYRWGWEPEPLVARTEHELPSFSDVRAWAADKVDPMGRRGNVSSGVRGAIRQVMPTHQLTGFNRHLFNSSQPGVGNLADNLTRAAEGVERVSREYAEGKVGPDWLPSANGKPREQAFREQNDKIDAATGLELTHSSRLDTHPAYPPDHPLNSHSRATPEQFDELQKGRVVKGSTTRSGGYNSLTPTQKQVFNDTFRMQRQLRIDEGDAAMRGIGKTYLGGVNDAQVETLVRQMRTMEGVNEILANTDTNPVARAFGDQWDGNKEFVRAIAAEWKRGWINNYVPLHRPGDWVVNFTDPQTGEKGMISRYTMREAEQARLQLEMDGAEPSLVLSRERRTPSDIPRLTIVDKFESKLQSNPALNPDQVTAARDLLTKVLLDQSRFAGRNRERLGVHGADPTKLKEAMAQRFQAQKNSVGHLEYGPQYEAGLNAMDRHVKEMGRGSGTVRIPDGSTGGRVATNADAIRAQQYMEEMRRRKPVSEDANTLLTKTAHNATMLTYFKFLASPAQTFMNGIDTYVQGIPRIGAQFGIGRATTALARASAEIMPRQFARGVAGTGAAARGRLDPGEWNSAMQIRDHLIANSRRNDAAGMNALFQRMQDGNLIGYSSYRDLQAMAKGGNGWIRQKADMAADMVSILHNKMEDANRAAVALAAYDVHFRKNGNRAAAVDYAEHILRTAMPNFGLSNKPRFATSQGGFGAWGIPVAQFRQHGMWAYSQMALDFRNAFKGADAATKTEARYALAFTIGMQTVLFGTLNWLADPLRYLWGAYDWASGGRPQDHSHDFRRYAQKLFGVTGGQFVSRGVLGAAGYGPYTVERMGMINAALVPKMEGDWKNPKDVTYAAMTAVAGVPALGAATEIITGLSNFAAGNYRQAAVDLLPKVLRDPVKAYTGETEGQISRRGTLLQTPEQISTLDTVYQVLGFRSARQGERSEQTGSQRQLIAEVAASRERATRDAAHALINGSASERRAADLAIKAHNRAYPGSQIDPKDVFNYRKREVERLRDPALTGIAVPKAMRPYVREAGAFANY